MKSRKTLFYSFFLILIVSADRLTKAFFDVKAENYGAAFGILQGHRMLFIALAVALIIIIIYYLAISKSDSFKTGLALVLAGTFGNLIDRIFYGYVIDVLKIPFFNLPSFNIADLSNLAGAFLLVGFLMKENRKV